jgi:hypothetical protein
MVEDLNVGSLWKLYKFYTTKLVHSYFHLYGRGYHHKGVDVDALAAGTTNVDDDPVALYLGYYNQSSSWQLNLLDLWIVHLLYRLYI